MYIQWGIKEVNPMTNCPFFMVSTTYPAMSWGLEDCPKLGKLLSVD